MRSTDQALTFCSSCGAMVSASTALASHWNGGWAAPGAAGGNVIGARAQAVAVVEMGLEIHVRFTRVNGADHEPRHAGRLLDRLVARAVGDDRARDLARAVELGRGDLRAIPHAVI